MKKSILLIFSITIIIFLSFIIISCGPKEEYTLIITENNGDVFIRVDGGTPPDNYPYKIMEGSEIYLKAIPDEDYTFGEWSGDLTGGENPVTFVMDGDKSITANFLELYKLKTSIGVGWGKIELDPPDGAYTYATEVTVEAVPYPGWVFDFWTQDLTGSQNPHTLIMDEEKSVSARFHNTVLLEGEVKINTYTTYDHFLLNDYVYVACGQDGIVIVDVSDPSNPTTAGSYDPLWDAKRIYVSGNYAYVVDWVNSLYIVDVSTPSSPALVGSYDNLDGYTSLHIKGNHAYVTDYISNAGSGKLNILDISTPSTPTVVGSYDNLEKPNTIYVEGDYAYVFDILKDDLIIIDISNPVTPAYAGQYSFNYVNDVWVESNYAYVTSGNSVKVLDVSDPSTPTEISSYDLPYQSDLKDIYVLGDYAYVGKDSGLIVLDISLPSNPTLIGSFFNPYNSGLAGLSAQGIYVHNTDYYGNVMVVDISAVLP